MADKAPTEGSDAAAKPELTEAQKAKIERKRAEKEAKKKAKAAKKAAKKAGGAGAVTEGGDAEAPQLSKKQLRELERKRRAEEAAAKRAAEAAASADRYGDLPLNQSAEETKRTWTSLAECTPELAGKQVLVRARVHNARAQGKSAFLVLRSGVTTMQATCFAGKGTPKAMVSFVGAVTKESVVDVLAEVRVAPEEITSCTMKASELAIVNLHVVSRAAPELPFQLDDAARVEERGEGRADLGDEDEADDAEEKLVEAALGDDEAAGGAGASAPRVRRAVRLNHRWIDLRTPANQGIMRIQAGVMLLFREFLSARGFVEIMTPKLLSGASEGGAEVFTLKYFGRDACLAQSPQLYKQMVAVGSDFGRVFEVGPVFRAENANTHKHLTEFHGLDMEMTFKEHYYEVLEVFSDLFIFIFEQLNVRYKAEIEAVRAQYPFEDFKFCKPSLKLTYAEGIELLRADGCEPDNTKDLGAEEEKRLGRIVKEKYGTDFFMMDRYPMEARPFYSMPCPDDPSLTNSYDFFMRGEEILSGAQRVHDPELLAKQAAAKGVPPESIKPYIDSFRHGAEPHGGGGVGLERVVMLFLDLANVRQVALFPRDPRRLAP